MPAMKRAFALAVMAFSLLGLVNPASADLTSINGIPTAGTVGQLLPDAYVLPGGTTQIQGVLNAYVADLYLFGWNGGNFTAYTTPTSVDNSLFLFDSTGKGLWASGDVDTLNGNYSASISATLAPGSYYLGVAFWALDPVDSTYLTIFPLISTIDGPAVGPYPGTFPLEGWTGDSYGGDYTINFTPATTPVPIPGAVWLLGSGLLGLVGLRRRFKK